MIATDFEIDVTNSTVTVRTAQGYLPVVLTFEQIQQINGKVAAAVKNAEEGGAA